MIKALAFIHKKNDFSDNDFCDVMRNCAGDLVEFVEKVIRYDIIIIV